MCIKQERGRTKYYVVYCTRPREVEMKLETLNRLAITGFLLLYFANSPRAEPK
jgi:hypothetical protein